MEMLRRMEAAVAGLSGATVAVRLPAKDLERARGWYRERLGLEPVEERKGGLRYVLAGTEFCLFTSTGGSDGSFTQIAFTVDDIDSVVEYLTGRGVKFEEYCMPGMTTIGGIALLEGNYPSKGTAERGAWFRDSEGNLIGVGEIVA